MSQPQFKPGDIVECINDYGSYPLDLGDRYKVNSVGSMGELGLDGMASMRVAPDRFKLVVPAPEPAQAGDPVNHPPHYTSHPSGVECIQVAEHLNFCLGNALKYLWRAGHKTADPIQDLEKARWYIEREIARIKNATGQPAR